MRRGKETCQVSVCRLGVNPAFIGKSATSGKRLKHMTKSMQAAAPETAERATARRTEADAREYLVHLEKINSVYYDQIKTADQKAAFIFTFMLAFLISSTEGSSVFKMQRYESSDWLLVVLSAVLAIAIVVSLVSSILVVLPRHRAKSTSLYWGGWKENREMFIAAHDARDPDYLFNEYLANVDNLAMINCSKYRHVSRSFRALTIAMLAYLLILLAGSAGAAP